MNTMASGSYSHWIRQLQVLSSHWALTSWGLVGERRDHFLNRICDLHIIVMYLFSHWYKYFSSGSFSALWGNWLVLLGLKMNLLSIFAVITHNGVRKVSCTERFVIKISLVGINAFQEADSQDPTCQPKVTSFRPCCLAKGRNLWDGSPVGWSMGWGIEFWPVKIQEKAQWPQVMLMFVIWVFGNQYCNRSYCSAPNLTQPISYSRFNHFMAHDVPNQPQ